MDDGTALLAAIHAAPRDDAPRLVYGDWLLEQGDPRGELIALQYKRRSGSLDKAAMDRETELIEEHGAMWLGELAGVARGRGFDRGFLSSVYVLAHDEGVALRLSDPTWSTVERILL